MEVCSDVIDLGALPGSKTTAVYNLVRAQVVAELDGERAAPTVFEEAVNPRLHSDGHARP
jgi:16S rRNA C967 or C1407 C5-methylase (RsmB/RsmF family)